MAINVKEEVRKGISYTKFEMAQLVEQINECKECIGYMSETSAMAQRNRYRISKIRHEIQVAKDELSFLKRDLKRYAEYWGFSKADVEAVRPATQEELDRDYEKDLKEADKPYNWNDLLERMAEYDREHPQDTQQFEIL